MPSLLFPNSSQVETTVMFQSSNILLEDCYTIHRYARTEAHNSQETMPLFRKLKQWPDFPQLQLPWREQELWALSRAAELPINFYIYSHFTAVSQFHTVLLSFSQQQRAVTQEKAEGWSLVSCFRKCSPHGLVNIWWQCLVRLHAASPSSLFPRPHTSIC